MRHLERVLEVDALRQAGRALEAFLFAGGQDSREDIVLWTSKFRALLHAAGFKRAPSSPRWLLSGRSNATAWLLNLRVDIDLPTYFPGFFPFATSLLTI